MRARRSVGKKLRRARRTNLRETTARNRREELVIASGENSLLVATVCSVGCDANEWPVPTVALNRLRVSASRLAPSPHPATQSPSLEVEVPESIAFHPHR